MTNYSALPKRLDQCTKGDINDFIRGTEQVFRFDLFGEGKNRSLEESYTTFDGKYHWSSNKDFFVYITDLTGTSDIRSASNVLYQTVTKAPEFSEPTMTAAPEYAVESNTLTPGQLKQLEEEENLRSAKLKQTQTEAEKAVKDAVKRKEELAAKEAIRKEAAQKKTTEETARSTNEVPQPIPQQETPEETQTVVAIPVKVTVPTPRPPQPEVTFQTPVKEEPTFVVAPEEPVIKQTPRPLADQLFGRRW